MNKKRIMIISVLLAVIAVALIQLYTHSIKEKYSGEANIRKVVVVRQDLAPGTVISKKLLAQKTYHKDFVPQGAILMSDLARIIGMKTTAPVEKGAPLLTSHFEEGAATTVLAAKMLSDMVLAGERATTIMVDEQSGVAGLLRPGDHVDIMGTFMKMDKKTGKMTLTTTTVIQNLPILAVGGLVGAGALNTKERKARGYRSVTLSVTLEEAELLTFAQQKSKLTLVLRNNEDSETLEDIPEINFDNLFEPELRKKIQEKRNRINRSRIKIIQ